MKMTKLTTILSLLTAAALMPAVGQVTDQQQPAQDTDASASGAPASAQQQSARSTTDRDASASIDIDTEKKNRDKAQQDQLNASQKNQQSTFNPGSISDQELNTSVTDINKASTFMKMQVQNLQNEKLGKVSDLVFDPNTGKIAYAVISIGGVLGVGDKLIAVPVTDLKARPGQDHLVLNMNKQQIESAPGLAANKWPNLDDPAVGAPASAEQETQSESEPEQKPDPTTSDSTPETP